MTTRKLAYLNPSMLRWARESAGFDVEMAASRLGIRMGRLAAAESGTYALTLRQAERAADLYRRPLATLYLPGPPYERSGTAELRRLPDAPAPPWPADVAILARRVHERQESAAELYEVLDEPPRWQSIALEVIADAVLAGSAFRHQLGVSIPEQQAWKDRTGYQGLRGWIDAVENLGILVIQESTVPIQLMRGFASPDERVPAVFLHTEDHPSARAFTLMHEVGHLLISASDLAHGSPPEQWCNAFAAEVLMPHQHFTSAFAESEILLPTLLASVDQCSLLFGVTPDASAVRVATLGLASQAEVSAVREQIKDRRRGAEGPRGGDYYRNVAARLGRLYPRLVFSALDTQAITYAEASALLGVKVNNFAGLREAAGLSGE